jgi:class 3 adenylate cyclase
VRLRGRRGRTLLASPTGFVLVSVAPEGRAMAGTRKIAAILVADVVGYSRLAGTDEDRTLSRLRGCEAT